MLFVDSELNVAEENAKLAFDHLVIWSNKNTLILNDTKTVSIVFQRSDSHQSLNSTFTLRSSIKVLGVSFDDNLQWCGHVEDLCNKLHKACFALRKLKTHCSRNILPALYYASVYSHIRYGIVHWGTCSQINRVFVLQKYAVRIIAGVRRRQTCRSLFIV